MRLLLLLRLLLKVLIFILPSTSEAFVPIPSASNVKLCSSISGGRCYRNGWIQPPLMAAVYDNAIEESEESNLEEMNESDSLLFGDFDDEDEEEPDGNDGSDNDDKGNAGEGKTYDDFAAELRKLAADKRRPGVVEKAEAVFDQMLDAHLETDDAALWPDTKIYNILLDMHAWSPAEDAAEKAEHYLNRMEDTTNALVARPNRRSYICVMDAWSNRREPKKVNEILERLETRFEQSEDKDFEPTTKVYNRLIKAWMKSGEPNAAQEAESILEYLIDEFNGGNEKLRPDVKTFVQVMRCFRQRKGSSVDDDDDEEEVDPVEKVKELLQQMSRLHRTSGEESLEPNMNVYNELIAAMGDSTHEDSSQQAEALLYWMIQESQDGLEVLKPNPITFRHVIYSFRNRRAAGLGYKIEKLLELQKGLFGENDQRNFEAALQVVAKSNDPKKVEIVSRLLRKMEQDDHISPSTASYNAVLNACAHPMTNDPDTIKKVMATSVEVLNKLRDNNLCNYISYAYFLKGCCNLLPDTPKRDDVVRKVFKTCCHDGHVGKFVLMEFLGAASESLVVELLGGNPEQDGVKIPRKWSRNVREKGDLHSS